MARGEGREGVERSGEHLLWLRQVIQLDQAAAGTWIAVEAGLGRIVALYHRSSALYQIC